MTPDCQHCLDLLDDFRRHTLSASQMAEMKTHLNQCPDCRSELTFRNDLASSLRNSLPDTSLNPGLSPAVLGAISLASQASPRQKSKLLPLMLSAAIVIIGIIAIVQQRAPELTAGSDIATLYRETVNQPVKTTDADTAVVLESRAQDSNEAEAPSKMLLYSAEAPASSPNLGLADQMVTRQKSADFPKKESAFAPPPSEVSPQVAAIPAPSSVPASASVPALATRQLYSESASVEHEQKNTSFDSKAKGPARTSRTAQAGAMAQSDRTLSKFYYERQTSTSDAQSTAPITSGTLSTTNTLTTGTL